MRSVAKAFVFVTAAVTGYRQSQTNFWGLSYNTRFFKSK